MDINSWLNQVKKDESELKLFTLQDLSFVYRSWI